MDNVYHIMRKELKSYFNSPIAYIMLIVFLLISGWFFSYDYFIMGQATMVKLFVTVSFIMILFVPALTMKLISEEKKSGTLELLVTMPLTDKQIIIGKFMSAYAMLSIAMVLTLVNMFTVYFTGSPDSGVVFSGYLNLFLLGAAYTAIGVFASSVTDNQIVAFILSFFIIFFLFIIGKLLIFLPSSLAGILEYISVDYHFENMLRGVIDTRNLLYYFSIIFLGIFGAVLSLERRKV
ncbi:MAG: ABC transporter permease [Candidatus Delongbacteria bacterium]|nr:ABC transporter permease [Candidatus Delongbacteria bacterium]MBN2835064.1 ABC transporter permease [Candidatus Delongbacteria bacterium]